MLGLHEYRAQAREFRSVLFHLSGDVKKLAGQFRYGQVQVSFGRSVEDHFAQRRGLAEAGSAGNKDHNVEFGREPGPEAIVALDFSVKIEGCFPALF